MSWHIKVEHIDDKTGECVWYRATVSDAQVEHSNLDILGFEFKKNVDTINLHLQGKKS